MTLESIYLELMKLHLVETSLHASGWWNGPRSLATPPFLSSLFASAGSWITCGAIFVGVRKINHFHSDGEFHVSLHLGLSGCSHRSCYLFQNLGLRWSSAEPHIFHPVGQSTALCPTPQETEEIYSGGIQPRQEAPGPWRLVQWTPSI